MHSGVNDNEVPKYSTNHSPKYIEFTFYKDKKDKVVIFPENMKNSLPENAGTYTFKYDGTKYIPTY